MTNSDREMQSWWNNYTKQRMLRPSNEQQQAWNNFLETWMTIASSTWWVTLYLLITNGYDLWVLWTIVELIVNPYWPLLIMCLPERFDWIIAKTMPGTATSAPPKVITHQHHYCEHCESSEEEYDDDE